MVTFALKIEDPISDHNATEDQLNMTHLNHTAILIVNFLRPFRIAFAAVQPQFNFGFDGPSGRIPSA
jgi:hypothetical protein